MARKLRIEYSGAIYHVMSRGNAGNPIFYGDQDKYAFVAALGEICERTGWRIHSYVLMPNHYHLQLETPEPNLVAGMKWLQGTYTQRFNLRNDTYGHLFQGRYKAIPVSFEGHYFKTLSNYIHLNPIRAKLTEVLDGNLLHYAWSSLGYYAKQKRPQWLETSQVLNANGFSDSSKGGIAYIKHLNRMANDILHNEDGTDGEEWSVFRRGWYVGDDHFRKELEDQLTQIAGKRESYSGAAMHKHDEHQAQCLLDNALAFMRLTLEEIKGRKYTDPDKCLVAWFIRRHTSVSNQWICDTLRMGRSDCFSRYPRIIDRSHDKRLIAKRARLLKCTKIRD